jgi:AraC-like DNA-binding protein
MRLNRASDIGLHSLEGNLGMHSELFTDFEAFVSSNAALDAKWLINGKVGWRSTSETVSAGDCTMLRRTASAGLVGEGIGTDQGYGFYLPHQGGIWTVNGVRLERDKIAVFEPGAEFCCHSELPLAWELFFIPKRLVEGDTGLRRPPQPYWYVVRDQKKIGDRVRNIFNRVMMAVAEYPEIEFSPAIRIIEGELRSLLEPLIRINPAGVGNGVAEGAEHPRLQPMRTIQRVGAILEERSESPMHVSELAARVGVSERTLRRAFNKYYGFGPRTYLFLRLVNKVRQHLLLADPDETTVTKVLTQWGVWEFGRFSGRYKRFFGELPSETLRRSRQTAPSRHQQLHARDELGEMSRDLPGLAARPLNRETAYRAE